MTRARSRSGRPRRPVFQNRPSRSVRGEGAKASGAPEVRLMTRPPPRSAANRSPPLISCTTPATTSAMAGCGPGRAAAMLTPADSSPAAAGRFADMGARRVEPEKGLHDVAQAGTEGGELLQDVGHDAPLTTWWVRIMAVHSTRWDGALRGTPEVVERGALYWGRSE